MSFDFKKLFMYSIFIYKIGTYIFKHCRNFLQIVNGADTKYYITNESKDFYPIIKLPDDLSCDQCILQVGLFINFSFLIHIHNYKVKSILFFSSGPTSQETVGDVIQSQNFVEMELEIKKILELVQI